MPHARFRFLPVFAVALLALALVGCGDQYTWNQKVTVEVETPNGPIAASSVMSMSYAYIPDWQRFASGNAYKFAIHGEAVALEIEPKRYLFALTPNQIYLVFKALHKRLGLQAAVYRRLVPKVIRYRGVVPLDPKDYPPLVTFTDLADPKTVRRVDPSDLAATFGSGYTLKAITLEITDDKVTEGNVGRILPWLATIGGGMLDGRKISTIKAENRLANDLSRGNFVRK